MKILGIETSSPLFSLCVSEDEEVLYEVRKKRTNEGSKDADLFAEAKKMIDFFSVEAITAIAISIGPGMFTSLRVGLSLAKGLALAHRIPIVAVNTLDVIGMSVSFMQNPVLVVINAYRGELYSALFRQGRRMTDYLLTTPQEAEHMVKKDVIVIGPGIDLFEKAGKTAGRVQAQFIHADFFLPTAAKVISVALPRIHKGAFDNPEILEPYYIKKTDAERYYNKNNAV